MRGNILQNIGVILLAIIVSAVIYFINNRKTINKSKIK